jgi:hypothetical protein
MEPVSKRIIFKSWFKVWNIKVWLLSCFTTKKWLQVLQRKKKSSCNPGISGSGLRTSQKRQSWSTGTYNSGTDVTGTNFVRLQMGWGAWWCPKPKICFSENRFRILCTLSSEGDWKAPSWVQGTEVQWSAAHLPPRHRCCWMRTLWSKYRNCLWASKSGWHPEFHYKKHLQFKHK